MLCCIIFKKIKLYLLRSFVPEQKLKPGHYSPPFHAASTVCVHPIVMTQSEVLL